MGGVGSGRYRGDYSARPRAAASLPWPISLLRGAIREAAANEGRWAHALVRWHQGVHLGGAARYAVQRQPDGELLAVLHYHAGGEVIVDLVALVSMPCRFGGVRWWWSCPGCGRRAGVLFNAARYWRCRHCHNVIYDSSAESHRYDHMWRAMGVDLDVAHALERRYRVAH